jgi:WD40 repeat protein
MKLFSKLRVRFFIKFLQIFVKNTIYQVTGFLDLLGILGYILTKFNNYALYALVTFTCVAFIIISFYIILRKKHLVITVPKHVFLEHTYHINKIALSPDEKYLASCSGDNFVILWDLINSKPLYRFQHPTWVSNVTFSPDNRLLYTLNGTSGTLNQWDILKKSKISSKEWFPKQAKEETTVKTRGLALSSDGRRMVITSERGSFVYIDPTIENFHFIPQRISKTEIRKALIANQDIYLSTSEGQIFFIDTSGGSSNWQIRLLYKDNNNEMIRVMAINQKKKYLAFTNSGGYLIVINLESNAPFSKKAHNGHAVAVCFNKSGNFIATGGQDNIIRLWKLKNGEPKEKFQIHGHSDTVTSLVFDSNDQLYSASRDKSIKVWNLKGLE